MRFVAQQFTTDGRRIAEREYRSEKGAWKMAGNWRAMFPYAPIRVIFRPENEQEQERVFDVPTMP